MDNLSQTADDRQTVTGYVICPDCKVVLQLSVRDVLVWYRKAGPFLHTESPLHRGYAEALAAIEAVPRPTRDMILDMAVPELLAIRAFARLFFGEAKTAE